MVNNNIFEFGYLSPFGVKPSQVDIYRKYLNKSNKSIINYETILTSRLKKFIKRYNINPNIEAYGTLEINNQDLYSIIINLDGNTVKEKICNYLSNNYINMRYPIVSLDKVEQSDNFIIRFCASELTISKYACMSGIINGFDLITTELGKGNIGFWYKIDKRLDSEPFMRYFEKEYLLYQYNNFTKYDMVLQIPWFKNELAKKYNENFIKISKNKFSLDLDIEYNYNLSYINKYDKYDNYIRYYENKYLINESINDNIIITN